MPTLKRNIHQKHRGVAHNIVNDTTLSLEYARWPMPVSNARRKRKQPGTAIKITAKPVFDALRRVELASLSSLSQLRLEKQVQELAEEVRRLKQEVIRSPIRKQELAWIREHESELSRYAGEWVVIEKNNLIAHNKNYDQARQSAIDKGITIPCIFLVEEQQAIE